MALSAHWKAHINAWQSSGLSQASYCRQHQLTYSTFSARLCEFRVQAKTSPPAPSVLLPIHVQAPLSQEASLVLHHARGHRLELPAGVRILAGGVMAMSGLIDAPAQIWLAVAPVDMRRGIDGLSSIVQQALGHSPCAGSAFVFHNCSGNRLKVLLWDGNGVWLCQRRLHQCHFVWPKATDVCFSMTPSRGSG